MGARPRICRPPLAEWRWRISGLCSRCVSASALRPLLSKRLTPISIARSDDIDQPARRTVPKALGRLAAMVYVN